MPVDDVNSSKPDPLESGLEKLRDLPSSAFFSMAPSKVLQQGLKAVGEGRVRKIQRNRKPNTLNIVVQGLALYVSRISADQGKLELSCDCPDFARAGHCWHSTAAFAAYRGVVTGIMPGGLKMESSERIRLRKGLAPRDEKKKRGVGRIRSSAAIDADSETVLKLAEGEPLAKPPKNCALLSQVGNKAVIRILGEAPTAFEAQLMRFRFSVGGEFPLPVRNTAAVLEKLSIAAQKTRFPFLFMSHDLQYRQVNVVRRSGSAMLKLDLDEDTVSASLELVSKEGESAQPVMSLGSQAVLLSDGSTMDLDENPWLDLFTALSPRGAFSLTPTGVDLLSVIKVPADRFNEKIERIDLHHCLDSEDPVKIGGSADFIQNIYRSEPHEEVSLEVRLEVEASTGDYVGQIGFRAGENWIPVRWWIQRFRDIFFSANEALCRSRQRSRILAPTLLALHEATTHEESETILTNTIANPVLRGSGMDEEVHGFFKDYQIFWKENSVPVLCVNPNSETPWTLQWLPLDKIAKFYAACCASASATAGHAFDPIRELRAADADLGRFLSQVGTAAAIAGIGMSLEGTEVEQAEISLQIDIEEHTEIDWFELSGELTCRNLSIPQNQWEELIRGELILRQDGKIILPKADSQEVLDTLQRLLKSNGSGSRTEKVKLEHSLSRLEVLEWMMLRKSGAEVRLPAEIEAIYHSLLNFQGIDALPQPAGLQASMRDYQKHGYEWIAFLYRHRFGACLADDMGLGKTLQAIAFLGALKDGTVKPLNDSYQKRPHLVVVPPSLIFNWHHEIERFYPGLSIYEYTGNERALQSIGEPDVILTTYDMVRRDLQNLLAIRFHVVIFDETQLLKNLDAARTQAAARLERAFTLCLTGTPMENHAGEYYSILDLAVPGVFGPYKEFKDRLNKGETTLLARAKPFVLRRTKEATLKELPPKTEQDIHLDMSPEQKEIYTRTVGEVRKEVLEAFEVKTRSQAGIAALTALLRLRQVCISPELLGTEMKHPAPKIAYLIEKLIELQEQGHAALIFSQFTRALDTLEKAATAAGLPYVRIDGKVPGPKRKKLVEAFQIEKTVPFFFISLKTGGVGLNLTRANYVFHLDPWWNPAVENQASDRAHRIGQEQHVFIQRLLMRHSVEEKMMLLKERKKKLFDQIMGASQGNAGLGGGMIAREDFEFLLSDLTA